VTGSSSGRALHSRRQRRTIVDCQPTARSLFGDCACSGETHRLFACQAGNRNKQDRLLMNQQQQQQQQQQRPPRYFVFLLTPLVYGVIAVTSATSETVNENH